MSFELDMAPEHMLLFSGTYSRPSGTLERAEAAVGRDEGRLGVKKRLAPGRPGRGIVILADFLPLLHVRQNRAIVLGVLH